MAIVGTTPEGAVDAFVAHLNELLGNTITDCRMRRLQAGNHFQIAFDDEDAPDRAITIQTRFGAMALALAQFCDTVAIAERSQYRVRTRQYAYSLTLAGKDRPLFRWEYVRFPTNPKAPFARHHLQGMIQVPLTGVGTLDDMHLPTGFVTVEEIIRFCIHDLEVRARSEDWHEVLNHSYDKFRTDFTS